MADDSLKVARARPQALVSDQARRAAAARAIAAVFAAMTTLAGFSTLSMSGRLALGVPQFLAAFGFALAYWLARDSARASWAGAVAIAIMLAQYVASSQAARASADVIAIAYFTALCPLVAAATMRARGVLLTGAAGALALLLQAWFRDQVAQDGWRDLVAASYYFAATWVVAVLASVAAERALRSHVREELRAAHAATATREAEGRYRLVAEHVSDLVSVLDDQGRFLYVSPSHERALGLPIAELRGRAAPELVHADDYQGISQGFLRALQAGSASTVARLRGKSGEYRWYHVRMSRIEAGADVVGSVAVSARDITEEQRLSEALEGTRRMESLGRLAGGVAHDFNNLLLVIQACTDLASQSLPDGHPARADLDDITRTSERAAALTKQLLTFARRQVLPAGQRTTVARVASELLPILQRLCGKAITISLEISAATAEVKASTVEIEQIIMNLAANARDAMPDGGKLDIAIASRQLADAEVSGVAAGDYVELLLADSGVGMSPEVQARIFEPFFTTKLAGRGTGLGLATVFGLVSQLGGGVSVASAEGRGSAFRVLLPCAIEERASGSLPVSKLRKPVLQVLVVDDEEAVRTLIARILEAAGHRVTLAASAPEALAAANQDASRFDLILTDVVLGAEDGLAMLDTLRAAHNQAQVVVMSGYSPTPERVAELARQGAEFLPKPFGSQQLLAALAKARPS